MTRAISAVDIVAGIRLPKENKDKPKLWLSLNLDRPYPTQEKNKALAEEAGMTMSQVHHPYFSLLTIVRSAIGL